ncbi:MAG: glutamine--fructose-6-phosphate aminotransferase, partial [Myxococcales bacterium]|nr:glutamine--fructose-6-phosphate aminotransferase [Myxococcales bacterium]
GGAIQGDQCDVDLRKGVGAPSVMADKLGITALGGRIFCGQVRWATFGAVDDLNAQPHVVRCHEFLYGAHNGNVTNSDELKQWLTAEGHHVVSDNDGEMVVHTVEHFFALELARQSPAMRELSEVRRQVMRSAIARASQRLQGSFAAVIVDPVTRICWAIKHGSSLYCGIGHDEVGGGFGIASSDLSSVLKLTRVVVPLVEGEFVELNGPDYQVYRLSKGEEVGVEPLERSARRSRLQAADIGLSPPYETFMDQEIAAQEDTVRDVVRMLLGGSNWSRGLADSFSSVPSNDVDNLRHGIGEMRTQTEDASVISAFQALVDSEAFGRLLAETPDTVRSDTHLGADLYSGEAGFLSDLVPAARGEQDRLSIRLLDAILERDEVREWNEAADGFVELGVQALAQRGRIYVVCCGSSYHAARAGALFFNAIAQVELICALPGEFRGQHAKSLVDGDVVLAVSQSGETKDLIDVLNDVIASDVKVPCVGLLNNVNSTLGQEKAEVVIPLRCGPEIAVPATKSFMNQVAVFYGLAIRLAQGRLAAGQLPESVAVSMRAEVDERIERLSTLPSLLKATFDSTDAEIEEAAQLLYLKPSMHLLAIRHIAVAREGALKIREVVLNHAEGFEGSEFKHGPNTILGRNTIWGPTQVSRLFQHVGHATDTVMTMAANNEIGSDSAAKVVRAIHDVIFHPDGQFALSSKETEVLHKVFDRDAAIESLDTDYPLVFITGPDQRDVLLTVSQINTHKIRGACTVVIAEDHAALQLAASKPPADNPGYRSVFITLPRTNDTLMLPFTATLVLQRLALKMSLLKMGYLDRLGFQGHGVHPDVPKNVSKSITVD